VPTISIVARENLLCVARVRDDRKKPVDETSAWALSWACYMYPNGFGMKERYYFQKARGAMVVDGLPKKKGIKRRKHPEVNERTNYRKG
jgi:hypothetical protein